MKNKVSLTDIIFGYARLDLPREKSENILDLLIKRRVIFKTVESTPDTLTLILPFKELAYIKKQAGDKLDEKWVSIHGTVKLVKKYRYRPGIIVGLVLALVMIACFQSLVWSIEISGNELISDKHILAELEKGGLSVGVRRNAPKLDTLTQNIMISDGNIGWISVNFRGTTAYVEVIEYTPPTDDKSTQEPCNIVARRDARISSIDVYSGVAEVMDGDTVKAGELLIGGIVDTGTGGYKLKCASGRVFGEVRDEILVKIPYEQTQKVATGRTYTKKSLIFLGNRLEFSKNSGKTYNKCDIIKDVRRIELFDRVKLPLELEIITCNEYEEKTYKLTLEQAKALAKAELEEKLAELSAKGELSHINVSEYEENGAYLIKALVYHTEDIAKTVPISQSK